MILTVSEDFHKELLRPAFILLIKKYSLVSASSLTLDLENRCRTRGPSAGRKTDRRLNAKRCLGAWPANLREALGQSWAKGREAKGRRKT